MNQPSFEERILAHVRSHNKMPVDWTKRRESWRGRVLSLFAEIECVFEKLVATGVVKIQRAEMEFTEEFIGTYECTRLTVLIGDQGLNLRPSGTLIVNAFGRIDVDGPLRNATLFLGASGQQESPGWHAVDEARWFVCYPHRRNHRQPLTPEELRALFIYALGM